jgi:hypothetical protein
VRFDRPELLYLLLLAVPVLVLHMVRRRWRRHPVPSLLLWERALTRLPRRPSLGVLASLLSLLLMVAAIGAGSLAAAGLVTGRPAPEARHLLLCVAASARMEGERWERAMDLAREEVRRKADADPVTLILVSERPRVLAARETDGARVLARLAQARPTLVAAAWELARPVLAEAVATGARAVAIGVRPEPPPGVAVHPVGGPNAGFTAFGVRTRPARVEIFARTAGAAPGAEIVVELDGREVARRPVAAEVEIAVERSGGGLLEVSLTPGAGPLFDDAAEAWIQPPPSLRVGVVAEEGPDPFLRAALAVAGPLVDAGDSGVFPPDRLLEAAERFDALVIAGPAAPARLPPGNVVLLTPPPEALGLAALPTAETSPIWMQARDHPVMLGVDAAEVQVMGATPARLPEGARALLGVPGGAVAAVGEREGTRWVWIGLDPSNSTLPVTASYPLLVRNALRWFATLRAEPLPLCFPLAGPLEPAVLLPPGLAAVAIEGPDLEGREVVEVTDGTFSWSSGDPVEGEVRVRIPSRAGACSARTGAGWEIPSVPCGRCSPRRRASWCSSSGSSADSPGRADYRILAAPRRPARLRVSPRTRRTRSNGAAFFF